MAAKLTVGKGKSVTIKGAKVVAEAALKGALTICVYTQNGIFKTIKVMVIEKN